MRNPQIAILGAGGFIGRNLLTDLLLEKNSNQIIMVPLRNPKNLGVFNKRIISRQCDHLDIKKLKLIMRRVEVIYHTAGLAWQHSFKTDFSQLDLLIEQLLQNSISAYFLGSILRKHQRLVWTSTSAIDSMFDALTRAQRTMLEDEVESFIESLFVQKNLYSASTSSLKNTVWKLVVKHILYSFSFALEFSYAYSKYVGQKILQKLADGNIKILKISDVYGPGQNISADLIKKNIPARRIQRFVALHALISGGYTSWIPSQKNKIHGFYKTNRNHIVQEIRNDILFPTYIDDVVYMIKKAAQANTTIKSVLQLNGNKVENNNIGKEIRNFCKTNVMIQLVNNAKVKYIKRKDDLSTLNIKRKSLIDFKTGLRRWLA